MSLSAPPRFVPTLTEIVAPQEPLHIAVDASISLAPGPGESASAARVRRILQRVDLVLEARLQDAVTQLVTEQMQALVPLLRNEIRQVVRESVRQAFEQENSST